MKTATFMVSLANLHFLFSMQQVALLTTHLVNSQTHKNQTHEIQTHEIQTHEIQTHEIQTHDLSVVSSRLVDQQSQPFGGQGVFKVK